MTSGPITCSTMSRMRGCSAARFQYSGDLHLDALHAAARHVRRDDRLIEQGRIVLDQVRDGLLQPGEIVTLEAQARHDVAVAPIGGDLLGAQDAWPAVQHAFLRQCIGRHCIGRHSIGRSPFTDVRCR